MHALPMPVIAGGGAYRRGHVSSRTISDPARTVATNKPPTLQTYRAVARSGACFAFELTINAVARACGTVNRTTYDMKIWSSVQLMP